MHYCWINGAYQEVGKANFHFYDLGILRGYGIFDYLRTYNKKPFQWDEYWNRFSRSSSFLGIKSPIQKDQALEIISELFERQNNDECAFRFILTGGFSEDSVSSPKANLIIVSEDLHNPTDLEYQHGIKVKSYDFVRDMASIKSTDYKHFLHLRPELISQDFSDVLYYKNGLISELSRSNVFIVNGKKLITPDKDILEGITRKVVLDLAKNDYQIELRPVTLEETLNAEEVFTTSTTKRILPITQIDNSVIGSGKIGIETQILLDRINRLVKNW